MSRLSICLLALGLLALPSQAATRADPAPAQAPREGMLDRSGGVVSGARAYAITGATIVYDRKGAPLAAPRLAPGRSVAFTVSADGAPKVRQLWLLD